MMFPPLRAINSSKNLYSFTRFRLPTAEKLFKGILPQDYSLIFMITFCSFDKRFSELKN
jgi:hypothetical protein